jgi:hypothetical protein
MRTLSRKVIALAVLAALAFGAHVAGAAPVKKSHTRTFSGRFTFHLAAPPCSALFCVRGVMHGSLGGAFDELITTTTPAGPTRPGVVFGLGTIVLHTGQGNLTCDESYVFDLTPVSDKEGGIICKFVSGTGKMAGASGHLELYGSQPAGSAPGSIGSGRYGGKLTLP